MSEEAVQDVVVDAAPVADVRAPDSRSGNLPETNNETKEEEADVQEPKPKTAPRKAKMKQQAKPKKDSAPSLIYINNSENVHIGNVNNITLTSPDPKSSCPTRERKKKPPPFTDSQEALLNSACPVSENHMLIVSKYLGKNWEKVGRALGFTPGELDKIEYRFHVEGLEEIIYQMCLTWTRERAHHAVGKLAKALYVCEEYDVLKHLAGVDTD